MLAQRAVTVPLAICRCRQALVFAAAARERCGEWNEDDTSEAHL